MNFIVDGNTTVEATELDVTIVAKLNELPASFIAVISARQLRRGTILIPFHRLPEYGKRLGEYTQILELIGFKKGMMDFSWNTEA